MLQVQSLPSTYFALLSNNIINITIIPNIIIIIINNIFICKITTNFQIFP